MKTGLRTEIVVSVVLLIGAALLFAGLLLVKLAERELLDQQLQNLHAMTLLFSETLADQRRSPNVGSGAPPQFESMLQSLNLQADVLAWRLLDGDRQVLAQMSINDQAPFAALSVFPADRQPAEVLNYASPWNPFGPLPDNSLDVAVAVPAAGSGRLLLQVRYSLAALSARVHQSARLVVFYVFLYGLVLAGFGIYLLNRNVVHPIRRLNAATVGVAAGNLEPISVVNGPAEIVTLAENFNQMVAALRVSRDETEAHIEALIATNTALQQARDDLFRSERMASVGQLAAGMAHEIGNPLGAVIGYLELLKGRVGEGQLRELAERSLAETERIDRLVRELLDYASPGTEQAQAIAPLPVLREATELLTNQGAFKGLAFTPDLPEDLPAVKINPHRFLQVLVNLLLNARDATPPQGSIRLAAGSSGDRVWFTVEDSGCGIDPASREKIFDPFYTTKPPGKGRGLGLSVCYRIIEEAGGKIEVRSGAGQGSSFTIWLDRIEEAAA